MRNSKGQTLIEVIVASTVGILVVVALTFATIFSLRNATFSKNSTVATKLAQEGMERVRLGRDRNEEIFGNLTIGENVITSWKTDDISSSIWGNRITGVCGSPTLSPPTHCYFNVDSEGRLSHLIAGDKMPALAEKVGEFKRVVIVSDDEGNYQVQKNVTVIVSWSDFSGLHESKLVTILSKQ